MIEVFDDRISQLDSKCYELLSKSCPYIRVRPDDLSSEVGLFLIKSGNVWVLRYGSHNLGYFTERDTNYPENLFVELVNSVRDKYGFFGTYRFAMGGIACIDYSYRIDDHYNAVSTLPNGIRTSLSNYGEGRTLERELHFIIQENSFEYTSKGALALCSKLNKNKNLWCKFTLKEIKEGLVMVLTMRDPIGNISILRIYNR